MNKISRPSGSKNKSTIAQEQIDILQKKVNLLEQDKSLNSYQDVVKAFAEGYVLDSMDDIKNIKMETLQEWFNSPDTYMAEISNLLTYYYIVDGNISQLYDMVFSLPQLDYKITSFEKTKTQEKDIARIHQVLTKMKHKQLTRELLIQLAHEGTLIATWLGGTKPYLYVFDNLKYVYPYGRYKGEMMGVIDLKWLKALKSDEERESIYNNLSPLVTKNKYEKWLVETNEIKKQNMQFISLPIDKTLVARTHILGRNQRLGIPFGTQAIFDIQHKNKMKELERNIADKIIRSMIVLKFKGRDDNNVPVPEKHKKIVFDTVKKVLDGTIKGKSGISVIAAPDFMDIQTPEIKNGDKLLQPEKYSSTNSDIANATGVSNGLTNGETGNFATVKLNQDMLYKKIDVLLEQIEEVYNQLIVIILGEKKGMNYHFQYNKGTPLDKQSKIEILKGLQAQGFSTTYLLDELGIDADTYYKQSIYEIEVQELRDKILPPMSVYTMSGKDDDGIGRPKDDSSTEDSTIKDKTNDGNSTPRADV